MIRLLIGGGRPLIRRGVRALLEQQPDFQVVAEASGGPEIVQATIQLRPDVVMLDVTAQGPDALEMAVEIRLLAPTTEVLVVSNYVDRHFAAEAFAAGAHGFLVTGDEPDDLFSCVRSLGQHKPFVGRTVQARVPPHCGPATHGHVGSTGTLTRRERTIVRLIAEGLRTREIAQHLAISEKTVESHRSAIFRKLAAETVADVVRYAVRNSMIDV
jgi:DNA-binding NarL/FixJ family response regulator